MTTAGSFLFEDVGVTAAHGALPLITDKTVLSSASGIMGTEAYHAGIIRNLLLQRGNEFVVPYPYRVFGFVQVISLTVWANILFILDVGSAPYGYIARTLMLCECLLLFLTWGHTSKSLRERCLTICQVLIL